MTTKLIDPRTGATLELCEVCEGTRTVVGTVSRPTRSGEWETIKTWVLCSHCIGRGVLGGSLDDGSGTLDGDDCDD